MHLSPIFVRSATCSPDKLPKCEFQGTNPYSHTQIQNPASGLFSLNLSLLSPAVFGPLTRADRGSPAWDGLQGI